MKRSILYWVSYAWNCLFEGKKLLPCERLVLDAWRASLPEDGRSILNAQLEAILFVQHQAGGAKVCFFYRENCNMPLFKLNQSSLHVATVLLRAENEEMMRARIFITKGRFFSIEFPKRPKRYMQQHHMQEQALQVVRVENNIIIS